MATISERLEYLLRFDTTQAIKAVDEFGKKADDALDPADAKLDKLGGNMMKFGAAAVAAAGVAGAALWKLGSGASDLNESINAVTVTFGDAAEGVLELGENAATAMGLSRTEFGELATGFAAFAQTIAGEGGNVTGVIEKITTRASDFASVMNMDVSRAVQVFQSGLAGETEALRPFGIDVSAAAVASYALANGIAESAKEMTEADKVAARYGVIMESTERMAGDFRNTSDDLANSQRIMAAEMKNLKDNIGAGLLPIMKTLVSTASDVMGAFQALSPEMQGNIGQAAGLGTAFIGLAGAASFATGATIKMRTNLALASTAMRKFTLSHPYLAAAMVATTAAAVIAGKVMLDNAAEQRELEERTRELSAALDEQKGKLAETSDAGEWYTEILSGAASANDLLRAAISSAVDEDDIAKIGKYGLNLSTIEEFAKNSTDPLSDLAHHMAELSENVPVEEGAMDANRMGDLHDAWEAASSILEQYTHVQRLATASDLAHFAGQDVLRGAAVERALAEEGLTNQVAINGMVSLTAAENIEVLATATARATAEEERGAAIVEHYAKQAGVATEASEELAAAQEAALAAEWDEWAASTTEAMITAQENYDAAASAAEEWAEGLRGAYEQGAASIQTFEVTADTSAQNYIDALNMETVATAQWEKDLASLRMNVQAQMVETGKMSGVEADEFVANIASMGEAGQGVIDDLNADASLIEDAVGAWSGHVEVASDDMIGELDPVAAGMAEKMSAADRALLIEMRNTRTRARNQAKAIGSAIPAGVAQGIADNVGVAISAVQNMIGDVNLAARQYAKMASPSRLFAEEVGAPIAEGIAEGIVEEGDRITDALVDAIESAEDDAIDAAQDLVDAVGDQLSEAWDAIAEADREEGLWDAITEAQEAYDAALGDTEASEEDVANALENLQDAYLAILEPMEAAITGTQGQRDWWLALAEQAGLTAEEIQMLVGAYDDLATAQAQQAVVQAEVSAEAAQAQQIAEDYAEAVRMGLIGEQALEHIAGLTGQAAIDAMFATLLNLFPQAVPNAYPELTGGGSARGRSSEPIVVNVYGAVDRSTARMIGAMIREEDMSLGYQ